MKPRELKHWLASSGVTQAQLARVIGVSRPLVTLWVRDDKEPPVWLDYVMDSEQFKADLARTQNEDFDKKMARVRGKR